MDERYWVWLACDGLIEGIDQNRQREIERVKCAAFPIYAITMFMSVYETDPDLLARYPWYKEEFGGYIPAIPFPFQVRYIQWLDDKFKNKRPFASGIVSKPRRMGITDWTARWMLAKWLHSYPFSGKFLSRQADLVDELHNMDAILERVASQLQDYAGSMPIPHWMLPPGWNSDEHRNLMRISRPDCGNFLGGESTTATAGRGGRATVAAVDEACFIRELAAILGAVQATAPHVITISSESVEVSEEFILIKDEMKKRYPENVYECDWWEHPFQDQEWLEAELENYRQQNREDAFYREILRQPLAGQTGWMYLDAQSRTVEEIPIEPEDHRHGQLVVGIDPGWSDETALGWMLMDPICKQDVLLNGFEAKGLPPEYYAAIIAGVDPEKFPEFPWPDHALELVDWVRGLPMKVSYIYGDPYGKQQRGGVNLQTGRDDDWYSRMTAFWSDNNLPLIPIIVNWEMKTGRELQGRRLAVMEWLRDTATDGTPRLKFNPHPEAEQTLIALQRSKWDESKTKRMSEAKDIYHDRWSHRRSMIEYIAVNSREVAWVTKDRPTQRRVDAFMRRAA